MMSKFLSQGRINSINSYTKINFSSGKMLVKVLVTLASIYSTCLAVNRGSIQVEGYGEVWVISPDWANVQVDSGGNSFTLHGNSRMYFASRGISGSFRKLIGAMEPVAPPLTSP